MFWPVICSCEGRHYKINSNMRDVSTPKLKLAAESFHVHSFAVLLVFSSHIGIKNFDWMFFIKLISWLRARPIF